MLHFLHHSEHLGRSNHFTLMVNFVEAKGGHRSLLPFGAANDTSYLFNSDFLFFHFSILQY